MEENSKLQRIDIDNDPDNSPTMVADNITFFHFISVIFALIVYIAIFGMLAFFGPKPSTTEFSNVLIAHSPTSSGDAFKTEIVNLSTMNQIIRVSVLYNNLSLFGNKLQNPIKSSLLIKTFDSQGNLVDSSSKTFYIPYDRPVPLFQTYLINFQSLEISGTIYSGIQVDHNLTFKYEYISSDATCFQLKAKTILSIISLSVMLYLLYMRSSSIMQVFSILLILAEIFYLRPLQFIYIYFPSSFIIPIELIFKSAGQLYIYFYCFLIFMCLSKKVNKVLLAINISFVILMLVLSLWSISNMLNNAASTIYPQEYNALHYNYDNYIKSVQMKHYKINPNINHSVIVNEAIEESFRHASTITKFNMSNEHFLLWAIVFCFPLVISILYANRNVKDVDDQRALVFTISFGLFAFLFVMFYGVNLILELFVETEWLTPLALLSAFTLLFSYLTLGIDNSFDLGYVQPDENQIDVSLFLQNGNDDDLEENS